LARSLISSLSLAVAANAYCIYVIVVEINHVKAWWDQDLPWTPKLIEEKYGSYIHGYKIEKGIKKPFGLTRRLDFKLFLILRE